jgi:hypothetical protein
MPPQSFGQGIQRLMGISLGMELVYVFVIVLCSLLIYFGTREIYLLSSHKGIKYFRLSFLFFALSYLFRFIIKSIMFLFAPRQIASFSPFLSGPIMQILFLYFSSMAVFYLLYSVLWKKIEKNRISIYLFHILAVVIAIVTTILNNSLFYLLINIILFLFVLIVFFVNSQTQKKKSKNNLGIIYFLLLLFWLLNIIDILIPTAMKSFQILIYLASISIFLSILYKVLRKIGTK